MWTNAIPMVGTIEKCWLFTFRVEPERIAHLLHPYLKPVAFGEFAYFNVVACRLRRMRPAFLPVPVGVNYHHVAYRLYARCGSEEGLVFLRSDVDSRLVALFGNVLTDFRMHYAKIAMDERGVDVKARENPLRIALGDGPPSLAPGSPFGSVEEAGERLKYKPAAISATYEAIDILRITRDESRWRYRLRPFEVAECPFLAPFDAVPEIAYEVEPIEYRWNAAERSYAGR